mgnify:CR=1 FL=1|jgi:UDP-GlcNAc:undecaprenyl-phosphate GlcNAc-1-phosphate transferase
MNTNPYVFALIIGCVLSYIFTPFVKKIAFKVGAVDIPKDDRRVHSRPIPHLGGLAIYLAFVITVLVFVPLNSGSAVSGMLIGGTLIVILGVIDDIKELSPKIKFAGQILAALVLVLFGVKVEWVTNPLGGMFYLGKLSIPLTIFWIVGITNTLNFIDGLDGLAAGISSIASFTLFLVALKEGNTVVVIMTAALAGAALGFLPYNFNPAKIFMGDAGAMFLGYILAGISIEGAIKSAAAIALIIPILALGLPIFDTAFAIIRRIVNGYPVTQADKDHIHHRLLARGLSQRQVVLIMYSINGALGMSAIVLSEIGSIKAGIVLVFLLAIILSAGRQWGIIDLRTKKFDA